MKTMRNKLAGLISKYRRFIIFCAIGGLNTAVDYAVFTLLYSFTALDIGFDQAAAYTAGTVNSFIWNKGITFKKGATTGLAAQIIRFIIINGITLTVSIVLLKALAEGMGMNALVAKVIVTVVVMIMNYTGYKIVVFGVKDKEAEGE